MVYKNRILKILFLTIIFFFTILKGQDNIIARYSMHYKKDSLESSHTIKDFVLLNYSSEGQSFYMSKDKFEFDSIALKNGNNALSPKNNFDFSYMTKKQFIQGTVTKYEKILNKLYTIDSKISLDWKIENDKKIIGIYTAQKAMLNFKGRVWEAWFTNDIPISDGPYIFNNLPGLILEIKDNKENFIFICNSISKNKINIKPFLSLKPITITQNKYKQLLIDHYNDPFKEMKYSNINVKWLDENGNEYTPDYRELTKNEQEAIRKNNNPIELDDAIIYK